MGSSTNYFPPTPPVDGLPGEFHDQSYDLLNMPLREHISHLYNAHRVHRRPELSADTGINGVPLILSLQTLRLPESFPLDAMHLFYQGIISRVLVKMFAGNFWADQSHPLGDDGMKIPRGIWIRMGQKLAVCIRFLLSYIYF